MFKFQTHFSEKALGNTEIEKDSYQNNMENRNNKFLEHLQSNVNSDQEFLENMESRKKSFWNL